MFAALMACVGSVWAQDDPASGALHEVPLPGGLESALSAIDDRTTADRSQFLLETIRRSFSGTNPRSEPLLRSLIDRLEVPAALRHRDTLPLPLPVTLWADAVFARPVPAETLVSTMLRSREASLLYLGLLSLDDDTRAWLATQPAIIRQLSRDRAAAFMVAAPGIRIRDGVLSLPGGEPARAAWEAVADARLTEPADSLIKLLAHGDGRLAYLVGALAELTPTQIALALNLESAAPIRTQAVRTLYAVFSRIARHWRIEERPFWRPTLDPALLLADLPGSDVQRAVLPGSPEFWNAAFRNGDPRRLAGPLASGGRPPDFAWLAEQIFSADAEAVRDRYRMVLFASRIWPAVSPDLLDEAIVSVRAVRAFPALISVIERTGLTDVRVFAAAARRAATLSRIGNDDRAHRAITQFQGALSLAIRAALRGGIPRAALPEYVSSLAAVEISDRGDYEGRLARWVEARLIEPVSAARDEDDITESVFAGSPADRHLVRMVSGPLTGAPRFVEWEGTRYRVDHAAAEAGRIARLLGDTPKPFVTAACAVLDAADALEDPNVTRDDVGKSAALLERIGPAISAGSDEAPDGSSKRYQKLTAALQRAARDGSTRDSQRLVHDLRLMADDLLARGLMQLVYAAALGQPERVPVAAGSIARRHEFHRPRSRSTDLSAWLLPTKDAEGTRGWGVSGSLLGLDVRLAEFSLMHLSARPPAKAPTMSEHDRRVIIETAALVSADGLTDADRDRIVSAIRKGRARLAAIRTPADAVSLADEIRLSSVRRSLLAWVVTHDPERVGAFLSPSELLWLGLENQPVDSKLHAWGVAGEPRLGCLCLQLLDRRPWETLAGRWSSGMLASAFSDLNLRLTELLADLQMPASVLGPVLATATLDFLNSVSSRYRDDRRGLVEFVQTLKPERVEQYLAFLTTDGPLVPAGDALDPEGTAAVKKEARR